MRRLALFLSVGALTATSACEAGIDHVRAASPPVALSPKATTASAAVRALQQVCLPLLEGGDTWKVARTAGFVEQDGQWVLPIDGESRLVLNPPDRVNSRLCSASITYPMDDKSALEDAVDHWAEAQTPPLRLVEAGVWTRGATYVSHASTWPGRSPGQSEGLALTEIRTAQGGPIAGDLDRSNLQLSFTATGRRSAGRPSSPGRSGA